MADKKTGKVAAHDASELLKKNLGTDFEVGVKLVSFGQTVVFAVHKIEYQNPGLIMFQGINEEDSSPIKLIQHVTQINFLLTSLPRKEKETPKQPIGFHG
jgi:hypothetical protein